MSEFGAQFGWKFVPFIYKIVEASRPRVLKEIPDVLLVGTDQVGYALHECCHWRCQCRAGVLP